MSAAVMINSTNFKDEVLNAEGPVLVDFWAEWCGPCKMLLPIIEELAGELEGQVKVCKLNVDEAQDIAAEYNIMSIPTLCIFKGGEPVDMVVGALPKAKIMEKVKAQI